MRATVRCPKCHQPIRFERFGIYLPTRKRRILDAIAGAGSVGIHVDDLIKEVWSHGEDGANAHCVRSHVQQINQRLQGFRIHIDGGRYFITRQQEAA
jgi:hypothetical protein